MAWRPSSGSLDVAVAVSHEPNLQFDLALRSALLTDRSSRTTPLTSGDSTQEEVRSW